MHQERALWTPSTWALFTVLPYKNTQIKMLTDWSVAPLLNGWKFSWDFLHTYTSLPESFVHGNDHIRILTFCPLFDARDLTSMAWLIYFYSVVYLHVILHYSFCNTGDTREDTKIYLDCHISMSILMILIVSWRWCLRQWLGHFLTPPPYCNICFTFF